MPKTTHEKFLLTLRCINISRIDMKYALSNKEPIIDDQIDEEKTTKLVDLNNDRQTPKIYPFLDGTKKLRNCNVSVIDFNSGLRINFLRYNCYWDRHPFETQPIGCPILYIPDQIEKTYRSCISKELYVIKENVTRTRRKILEHVKTKMTVVPKGCYITDGVFCSFNCCQAWIIEMCKMGDYLYEFSEALLADMYNEMMGTTNAVITPAHHWRTLEPYGGFQTIVRFRDSFNSVTYQEHGSTIALPKFKPIGMLYEEKINF